MCAFQKLFVVPSTAEQSKIPFARVNHAKFMVTDNTAYIGMGGYIGYIGTIDTSCTMVDSLLFDYLGSNYWSK